jgi:hypothetical protein
VTAISLREPRLRSALVDGNLFHFACASAGILDLDPLGFTYGRYASTI